MYKFYSSDKNITSYKRVKILQSFLLVVFGIVLCIFSNSTSVQNALGYISASIILLYSVLTIGFGLIFSKGIFSSETISGTALASLSVLIFIFPHLIVEYIPIFAAVFLIILSLIILIDLISIYIKKEKGFWIKFLYIFGFIVLIGLGITILLLNFSSNEENQSLIKMILIILIGILLIIVGSFLIFYYAMNPKFKVTSKEFVTDDGKKVTISTSETTVKIKRKKNNRKNKEISNNEESTSLTVADDTNKQN